MEPLFSYFNIRDFSALLRTVSRSSFERLKKRTASTVFLWRFLSARREKFSRECFARIEIPRDFQLYDTNIDINFTDELIA